MLSFAPSVSALGSATHGSNAPLPITLNNDRILTEKINYAQPRPLEAIVGFCGQHEAFPQPEVKDSKREGLMDLFSFAGQLDQRIPQGPIPVP